MAVDVRKRKVLHLQEKPHSSMNNGCLQLDFKQIHEMGISINNVLRRNTVTQVLVDKIFQVLSRSIETSIQTSQKTIYHSQS
jgi:hypothetical protein